MINYGYALLEWFAQRNTHIAFFAFCVIVADLVVLAIHPKATFAVNNLYVQRAIRSKFKEAAILERYSNS